MNQQSYVKAVAKRLACSKERRGEFARDLESDIAAALASGETWQRVEQRLGDPRQMAQEFNEGLSDAERAVGRRRKRNRVIALAIAALLVMAAVLAAATWWATPRTAPAGQGAGATEQQVLERAREAVGYMGEGDYDALRSMAPASLRDRLPDELLNEARSTVGGGDWGAFTSFGTAYANEVTQAGQTIEAVEIVAVYENAVVTYTLTFDENLQMTNFFVR